MSKMASNFGKFFSGISKSKKKAPKSKTKDDDSEDDSFYEDPTNAFPTDAPSAYVPPGGIPPNNPPRYSTGNATGKERDDYIDPFDSKENGVVSPAIPCEQNSTGNYANPFDAKFNEQHTVTHTTNDNSTDDDGYDSPYEPSKFIKNTNSNNDNYSEPWDMGKSNINTNKSNVRHINKPDEYSDPWDTKNSSSPKSQDASFDDNYSEPYDKGKSTIIDDKKYGSESVEDEMDEFSDKERRWIGLSVSKGSSKNNSCLTQKSATVPTQAKVACSDKASAVEPVASQGDYDSPWDWKVKQMEKDFGNICQVVNQETETDLSQPVCKPEYVNENRKSVGGVEDSTTPVIKGYQVDPTIPLVNQGWFHGRIRRGEAEKLLEMLPDCSYLIRNSESSKTDFSLSIRNNGMTIHLKISYCDGKYILGKNSPPFDTIQEMTHFYSMNDLNIRGAEQVKLQYPVLQEALYFTVLPGS